VKFLKLVWQAAGVRRLKLAIALMGSTFGMIGVLVVVSQVLDPEGHGGDSKVPDLLGLFLFVTAAFSVILGNAIGQRLSVAIVEDLLDRIRRDYADLVRRSDYGRFEAFGGTRVYDTLTRNSQTLTEAAIMSIHGVAAFGALALGGLYTLIISPLVFAVIIGVIIVSTFFFRLTQRQSHLALTQTSERQTAFFSLFRHLIDGFKEVKLHNPRGESIEHEHLDPASAELRDSQIFAAVQINRGVSVSYFFFYLMLATIAFVLPPFVGEHGIIVQSLYVAIFMLSVVEIILKAVPIITRASFAIDELNAVEQSLREVVSNERAPTSGVEFERIEAQDLMYSYFDPDGARSFTMGPTGLDLNRGEVLFIVGGNGSGKSTLMKAFTRLYEPESGMILWDGNPVDSNNVTDYRTLFSSVFSDFHLFDRLYGLPEIEEKTVNDLLDDLGIAHKTRYRDGVFTNTNLSTGQRKRLALAVALLENRPILLLDELGADQDPEFRKRFYNELIPSWKKEGRTLVIVSHEDQYFHVADRTIVLSDGQAAVKRQNGETT